MLRKRCLEDVFNMSPPRRIFAGKVAKIISVETSPVLSLISKS